MSKKHFNIVGFDGLLLPFTTCLPVNNGQRSVLTNYLRAKFDIHILPYEIFERGNMRKQDLVVFTRDFNITFQYDGSTYHMTIKAGAVTDHASVPKVLVQGDLTKQGQHIETAATVHDALFALKLMTYKDSNNVFDGIIKQFGLTNRFNRWRYSLGVNSPVGRRLYRKNNPDTHWLRGYVTFHKNGEKVWPNTK